jgi:DNA (cytosine-5)-methyltransferase 1
MRTDFNEIEIDATEEPQLNFIYSPEVVFERTTDVKNSTLNVLSLFSGCGGMDLGFEGGFEVLP